MGGTWIRMKITSLRYEGTDLHCYKKPPIPLILTPRLFEWNKNKSAILIRVLNLI